MPFIYLCIAWVCFGDPPPSTIIARVDQHPITTAHVDDLLAQRFPAWKENPTEAPSIIRGAIAESLVSRQLAMSRLQDLGQAGLEAKVERQLAQETERLRRASQVSSPDSRLGDVQRDRIAWKVAWSDYLETYLTEENLRSYFQKHRIKFDGTERFVFQVFLPDDPENEARLKQVGDNIIAGKRTFELAAAKHSESASADDGGSLGWVRYVGDLPPTVSKAVFDAKLGLPVGPIRSPLGWHLVLVREQRDGTLDYETFVDHQTLRRDAADFLFDRLVEAGKSDHRVHWIDPKRVD